MEGEVFVILLVAIGCFTGIAKAWINRNNHSSDLEENFDRLAKAFMQHKKEMKQRVENLEAIIADADIDTEEHNFDQIETNNGDRTLSNDLQSKDRVRS